MIEIFLDILVAFNKLIADNNPIVNFKSRLRNE